MTFFSYAYILNLISCSSENIYFTKGRKAYTQRGARSPRGFTALSNRLYLSPIFTFSAVIPTG